MRKIIFILLVLIWPRSIQAFPLSDARSLALGGMPLASVSPEAAVFLNPAVLGGTEVLHSAFSQGRLSVDTFQFQVASCAPLLKGVLGMGLGWDAQASRNQALTGIVRDSNGQVVMDPATGLPQTQVLGFFTRNQNTFFGALGLNGGFYSLGASAKYFLTDFGGIMGTGWGFDASFLVKIGSSFSIGAALFDITDSRVDFGGAAPDQATPALWAASARWNFWNPGDFSFQVEPGLSRPLAGDSQAAWSAGVEAAWLENVFARVGCNREGLSFGVGLSAHPEKVFSEIRVDYTYLAYEPDGFPSRLTLAVGW